MNLTQQDKDLLILVLNDRIKHDQLYIEQTVKQVDNFEVYDELTTPYRERIEHSKGLIKKLR